MLAEVLHGSDKVRTDIPPVKTLKEHRGPAELRAKQEVRMDKDHEHDPKLQFFFSLTLLHL